MAKIKSAYQGQDGTYYIVNPAGAIHTCDRAHATNRLRTAGWRLAEDAEIEVYREQRIQRHDRPIAERWSPEPEIETDLPDATGGAKPEATDAAVRLADSKGVDLATIAGSGAGGRITVADVEAVAGE